MCMHACAQRITDDDGNFTREPTNTQKMKHGWNVGSTLSSHHFICWRYCYTSDKLVYKLTMFYYIAKCPSARLIILVALGNWYVTWSTNAARIWTLAVLLVQTRAEENSHQTRKFASKWGSLPQVSLRINLKMIALRYIQCINRILVMIKWVSIWEH